MPKITLQLSPYTSDNPNLKSRNEAAIASLDAGNSADFFTEYKNIRDPGVEWLRGTFCDLNPILDPTIGWYDTEMEPSIQVGLEYKSIEDLISIKRGMIEFADRFDQKNVHLVDLYAIRPNGVPFGSLVQDATYQRKLWIRLQKINGLDLGKNIQKINSFAEESKTGDLTMNDGGTGILRYSMGTAGDDAQFTESSKRLITLIEEEGMLFDVRYPEAVEVAKLVNYGNPAQGGTHTFEQAKQMLADSLK